MRGKISTVVTALKELLKVLLPVGVKFSICSFGTIFHFFGTQVILQQTESGAPLKHVDTFSANLGGIGVLNPVRETVKNRYKDMELNVLIMTDGHIWGQQQLFDFINEAVQNNPVKFFSLGIGPTASRSLIEGIARAGNGFAQSVAEGETLDQKMITMLQISLTPHQKNLALGVKYDSGEVEKVAENLRVMVTEPESTQYNTSGGPSRFLMRLSTLKTWTGM